MPTAQPIWKLIANLGDVNPIEHGGIFIFEDTTGQYEAEAEVLQVDDAGRGIVYRFSLPRCSNQFDTDATGRAINEGILSDNKYHPDFPAWFAKPESERATRPQDTTYLSNVASFVGTTMERLIFFLTSESPIERAHAYLAIGEYHGFENFDSEPLRLTKAETKKRYSDTKYKMA